MEAKHLILHRGTPRSIQGQWAHTHASIKIGALFFLFFLDIMDKMMLQSPRAVDFGSDKNTEIGIERERELSHMNNGVARYKKREEAEFWTIRRLHK